MHLALKLAGLRLPSGDNILYKYANITRVIKGQFNVVPRQYTWQSRELQIGICLENLKKCKQSKVQYVCDSIIIKHVLRHGVLGGSTGFIWLR
jgi:hypothetical protein